MQLMTHKRSCVGLRRSHSSRQDHRVRFIESPLPGAYIIDLEPIEDESGFLARSWCEDELRARGLDAHLAQCNLSYNRKRGTLRGMHFQALPCAETKIVRCTRGSIH